MLTKNAEASPPSAFKVLFSQLSRILITSGGWRAAEKKAEPLNGRSQAEPGNEGETQINVKRSNGFYQRTLGFFATFFLTRRGWRRRLRPRGAIGPLAKRPKWVFSAIFVFFCVLWFSLRLRGDISPFAERPYFFSLFAFIRG